MAQHRRLWTQIQMTAQLSKHLRAHMYRGGNCGKSGSFAYRRFLLEEMAEEVASSSWSPLFKSVNWYCIVHTRVTTWQGHEKSMHSPHLGSWGVWPQVLNWGWSSPAHIYVFTKPPPNEAKKKKKKGHQGKRLKYIGYYERSALGNIIYQKEWKSWGQNTFRDRPAITTDYRTARCLGRFTVNRVQIFFWALGPG